MEVKLKEAACPTADPGDAKLAQQVIVVFTARHRALRSVSVRAERGTVRLEGTVSSYHLKQLAFQVARHVPGVVTVRDELDVG